MSNITNIQISMFENIKREKKTIDLIKAYAPLSLELTGKPFYVAYSGGKDSDAIRILCELAGIKYDLVHNHTTADAPETVRYIRSIPNIQISYPETTMWKLIVKKKFPPTRMIRYCCAELKEREGKDRFVMTGVRWSESAQRKSRGNLEIQGSTKKTAIILNADNDRDRRSFETCMKQGKRILNPIIEWIDDDVWEFLDYYNCQSNPLYANGYKRVGCIGCPMAGQKRWLEFMDYPKYKEMYIRAFDRMIKHNPEINYKWKSGEEVFYWCMSDKRITKELEGQISMFE